MKLLGLLIALMLVCSLSASHLSHDKKKSAPSNPFAHYNQFYIEKAAENNEEIKHIHVHFSDTEITTFGCNPLWNSYTVEGKSFKVGPNWGSTKIACPSGLDAKLTGIFSRAEKFIPLLGGDRTQLLDANNKWLLTLRPSYE